MGFFSLLLLAQALGNKQPGASLHVGVVTNNAHAVTGEEEPEPEKATSLGPSRVIPHEYQNITCRSVDVIFPARGAGQDERLLESLLAELTEKPSEQLVAYRGGNRWALGATAARMRLYHSTALLLPDATVLTMGGGAPGPQRNLNAEIYYPPYLFDAAGQRAPRPVIQSAPTGLKPRATFTIGTTNSATIQRVVLVKSGSVTHSFNFDQRSAHLNTEMGLLLDSPALGRRLTAAFDEDVPRVAYEVRLAPAGGLEWVERGASGETRHADEPGAGALRRGWIWFLSLLPIEWLL